VPTGVSPTVRRTSDRGVHPDPVALISPPGSLEGRSSSSVVPGLGDGETEGPGDDEADGLGEAEGVSGVEVGEGPGPEGDGEGDGDADGVGVRVALGEGEGLGLGLGFVTVKVVRADGLPLQYAVTV
jgi:hypothetical protein